MNILDTMKYKSRFAAVPLLGSSETFVHTYQTTLSRLRFQLFQKVKYQFLKFLKCGAKGGWRVSVGLMVLKVKYYTESMRKGTSYIQ